MDFMYQGYAGLCQGETQRMASGYVAGTDYAAVTACY